MRAHLFAAPAAVAALLAVHPGTALAAPGTGPPGASHSGWTVLKAQKFALAEQHAA